MNASEDFDPQSDPRTLETLMGSLRGVQLYMMHMEMTQAVDSPFEYLSPQLREHILWLEHLEKTGVLFLAGANRSGDEWDGSGTAILRADSLAHARAIADAEPFHRAGLRTNRVHGWLLNEGSLRLDINLFTNRFHLT